MSDESSNINTAGTESSATTTNSAPAPGTAGMAPSASQSAGATQTVTITEEPATQTSNNEVLRLTLQDRRGVRWYVCFDLYLWGYNSLDWNYHYSIRSVATKEYEFCSRLTKPYISICFSIQTGRKGL